MAILSFPFWGDGSQRVTIKQVAEMIGPQNTYSEPLVRLKLGLPDSSEFRIRHSLKKLKWVCKRNKEGEDYRFLPYIGHSFQEILKKMQWEVSTSPEWIEKLQPEEPGKRWLDVHPVCGYNLVNFKLQLTSMSTSERDRRLRQMKKELQPVPDPALVEMLISIRRLSKDRLLSKDVHCGSFIDAYGCRLKIGLNTDDGISLFSSPDNFIRPDHGVILCVRPDLK